MGLLDHGKELISKRQKQEDESKVKRNRVFNGLVEAAHDRLKVLKAELKGTRGLKVKEANNVLCLLRGGVEIATVRFSFDEKLEYDSDGGAWRTGNYYPDDKMKLKFPHEDTDGCKRGASDNFEPFSRDHLAVYLAQMLG